jgi:beta-phosphoglucomutase family hydrolase
MSLSNQSQSAGRIKAVIFDMDGVLVDSNELHFRAFSALGTELGVPFTRETLLATVGMHNNQILPLWLGPSLTSTAEQIKSLALKKEELYRNLAKTSLLPTPGALACVAELKNEGYLLAVGSSGPRLNVALALDRLQIKSQFQAVVTGDDARYGKPAPDIFLLAAERLGLPPESCCVIEDAPQGVEAALAAKMKVIGLTTTQTVEAMGRAHLVVPDLRSVSEEQIKSLE